MTAIETVNYANGIYCTSSKTTQLSEQYEQLKKIIADKIVYQDIKENATALMYKIKLKELLLICLKEFSITQLTIINDYIERALPVIEKKQYQKTIDVFKNAQNLLLPLGLIIKNYNGNYFKITDINHNRLTKSVSECEKVESDCNELLEEIKKLENIKVFPENVKFVDVQAICTKQITTLQEIAKTFSQEIKRANINALINKNTTDIEKVLPGHYQYFPIIDIQNNGYAKTIVISSPIIEEVYLYTRSLASQKNIAIKVIDVFIFQEKIEAEINDFFEALAANNCGCLLINASSYHKTNLNNILKAAIDYGKNGNYCLIYDYIGDKGVYNQGIALCEAEPSLDIIDISHIYLTMPYYEDLKQLLIDSKMIENNDMATQQEIKEKLPFMGFLGLNKVFESHNRKENWIDEGYIYSQKNLGSNILTYLSHLPSQYQLIDGGWGDYSQDIQVKETPKKEFDYDSIRNLDIDNIKKIINSNYNIITKCGLVSRYCLLAGDDISLWNNVSLETKQERTKTATYLIFHLLNIPINPIITFVKSNTFAGLCVDGGKEVRYDIKTIEENPEYFIGTICHECRHAFQHMLTSSSYYQWYFDEFGVTESMIDEWRYNFSNYCGLETDLVHYKIQVVESDARAFASDAERAASKAWNSLDLN